MMLAMARPLKTSVPLSHARRHIVNCIIYVPKRPLLWDIAVAVGRVLWRRLREDMLVR